MVMICSVRRLTFSIKVTLALMAVTAILALLIMASVLFKDNATLRAITMIQWDGPLAYLDYEQSKSRAEESSKRHRGARKYLASDRNGYLQNSELESVKEANLGKKLDEFDQHLPIYDKTKKIDNMTTSRRCNDVLCTSYLSESDLSNFYNCQHTSTRRYQRFLEHRFSANATARVKNVKPKLAGGILATGKCKFMDGKGEAKSQFNSAVISNGLSKICWKVCYLCPVEANHCL